MLNGEQLLDLIYRYYFHRSLKTPTTGEALDWAITEIAEAQKNLAMQHPTSELFAAVADLIETVLRTQGGWVRNNPEKDTKLERRNVEEKLIRISELAFSLIGKDESNQESIIDETAYAEELGDVIMMVMVAGMVIGVDPIEALCKKIHRKAGLE